MMTQDWKQPHREDIYNNSSTQVRVECYAGYRGEESPRRFFLGTREIAVVEILDRGLDPTHRYFKLRGDDEGIYILRHDMDSGSWEMTLFNSG